MTATFVQYDFHSGIITSNTTYQKNVRLKAENQQKQNKYFSVGLSQDLLMNDQVKEFSANVYETFSMPLELQK